MGNTRKSPKNQASAVEQCKDTAALVTVEHGRPVTTTEAVARAAGVQHKNVIALVREHLPDFEEFGLVAFQTRARQAGMHGGGDVEFARLNEPQSALLFTFLKNTPTVRAVKVRLVREFFRVTAELNRLKTQRTAPEWQAARLESKRGYQFMSAVVDGVRAGGNKPTTKNTFIHEARVVAYAMTGDYMAKVDREKLPPADLVLLDRVQAKNGILFACGMSREDRKAACRTLVMQERGLLLKGGQP